MEEEDLSLNWTVFRHFPPVWSGRDDEEKASKITPGKLLLSWHKHKADLE